MAEQTFAKRHTPLKRAIVHALTNTESDDVITTSATELVDVVQKTLRSEVKFASITSALNNLRREGFVSFRGVDNGSNTDNVPPLVTLRLSTLVDTTSQQRLALVALKDQWDQRSRLATNSSRSR